MATEGTSEGAFIFGTRVMQMWHARVYVHVCSHLRHSLPVMSLAPIMVWGGMVDAMLVTDVNVYSMLSMLVHVQMA